MAGVLAWLVVVELIALGALPLVMRVFRSFPDRGLGLAKIVGLAGAGYLCWLSSMVGFVEFGRAAVTVVVLAAAVATWWTLGREAWTEARLARSRLLATEVTFLIALALAATFRAYNADIVGQEKFMDFAIMNAFLAASDLPAEDPWLAGYGMPYYYLGYLILAVPAKIAGTPGPVAYNLAVAFVFAATVSGVLSIVQGLLDVDASRIAATAAGSGLTYGILGGVLVAVLGNLEGALEFAASAGLGDQAFWRAVGVKGLEASPSPAAMPGGAWWWRASRVIPNIQPDGITEFPYFSFILGDLHPHYIALPLDLALLACAALIWLRGRACLGRLGIAVAAVLLGTLVAANTWDVPVFWGILMAALAFDAWLAGRGGGPIWRALAGALAPFLYALLAISPYFIGYTSQQLGIGFVGERTPLPSMLILFGPFLAVAALFASWLVASTGEIRSGVWRKLSAPDAAILGLACLVLVVLAVRGEWTMVLLGAVALLMATAGWAVFERALLGAETARSAAGFAWLLSAAAVATLLGVEVVFIRDLFGTRMNTVFKLHYNAWLLFGVASAIGLGVMGQRAVRRSAARWGQAASAAALLLFAPGLIYPLAATWTKSGGFRGEPTLDGAAFLRRTRPGDAEAIAWLRSSTTGRPVVVEAVGPDYQEFARISTFSGLPTVVGWIGHEAQWRGERIDYGRRERDVDAMYRTSSREELIRLAEPYRARYLVFGTLERERYGEEAFQRLSRLLVPAFTRGGTTIYAIPDDLQSAVAG